jgi:hypothetical protein
VSPGCYEANQYFHNTHFLLIVPPATFPLCDLIAQNSGKEYKLCGSYLVTLSVHKLLSPFYIHNRNRGSSVGIATGYGLDDRGVGVRVPVRSRILSSQSSPDQLWVPLFHINTLPYTDNRLPDYTTSQFRCHDMDTHRRENLKSHMPKY